MADDPLDLDVLFDEASRNPFRFRFDGEVYECPVDVSLEFIELLEQSKLIEALQTLLGPDQWERLHASNRVFGVASYGQVLQSYAEHVGTSLPNSLLSIASSANTDRR
jgi:hypothetical protein